MIVLPPKRFEPVNDTRFDGIRHKPWFFRLEERREKLPLLREAMSYYDGNSDVSQMECAAMFRVDERELRDYISFVTNSCPKPSSTEQKVLDCAYEVYELNKGDITIKACLDRVAGFYGKIPRHIMEIWETNPSFFPTNYVYQIAVSACLTNDAKQKSQSAGLHPPRNHQA